MSTVNVKPLGDRVVIKVDDREAKTASGIIIPDNAGKEKPEQGTIVAVGPGEKLENGERSKLEVKVGDKVLFSKYTPEEITVDNEKYLIVKESNLLAIISE